MNQVSEKIIIRWSMTKYHWRLFDTLPKYSKS
jgi:hypothetical protein